MLELTVRADAGAIDHQVQRFKTAGDLVKEPLTVFLDGQIGGDGQTRDGSEPSSIRRSAIAWSRSAERPVKTT